MYETKQEHRLRNGGSPKKWTSAVGTLPKSFLSRHVELLLLYCPYLSSIHEKANCIAIFRMVCPHSLGSFYFRGVWATFFHIKAGASRKVPCSRTQQATLPACSPQPPINAERQAGKLWIPFFKSLLV